MPKFITQSADIGSLKNAQLVNGAIPNALATAELDTAILTDPLKIKAYKDTVADQLNGQSGGPKFKDLSDRIAGMRIETSAQGAGILVVDIIDPFWVLPMSGFIQVFDDGYLAPLDINFPTKTDCWWRLAQYRAVWDAEGFDSPSLTLTFEDRIVSYLREMNASDGISQGTPNQTLGGFFKQLVDSANKTLKLKPQIRLLELVDPQDPNYTVPVNQLPQSAQSPLRKNPNKSQQGLSDAQQKVLDGVDRVLNGIFGQNGALGRNPTSGLSVRDAEQQVAQGWSSIQKTLGSFFSPASASNPFGISASNPSGIDQAGFGNNP